MGRARQIAGNENQDRIILDSSDGTADAGDFLLLDASAATTDVGFFINTEDGTGEVPGLINTAQLADDAVTADKVAANSIGVSELALSDGTANQAIITDGSATLSFGDVKPEGAIYGATALVLGGGGGGGFSYNGSYLFYLY